MSGGLPLLAPENLSAKREGAAAFLSGILYVMLDLLAGKEGLERGK